MTAGHALGAWVGLMVVVVSGCSDNLGNLQAVSGTVQLKGQPLDQGIIEFIPVGSPTEAGDAATKSGAAISNGKYSIPRETGLVPGKYKVIISSGDGVNIENPEEPPGPTGNYVSRERIPAEYNAESKQEVTVAAGGANQFNFDIP
jgi:hypothetical protein